MQRLKFAGLGRLAMATGLLWSQIAHAGDAPATRRNELASLNWHLNSPPSTPPTRLSALGLATMLPHDRDLGDALLQKSKSVDAEIGDVRMTLAASRTKGAVATVQNLSPRSTVSDYTVAGAVEFDLGKADSVGFFGNWTKERRKPLILFPSRRHFSSDAQSFGLGWTHNDRFVASLTRFSIGPSGSRTPTERMFDLAGGGFKKATGLAFTLTSLPPEKEIGATYGFDLRQQRSLESGFTNFASARNETIGTLFLAYKF